VIGRRWRAPLGLLLGVNAAFGQNAPFAAVTALSIAASVALATGLETSARAVQTLADRTAEALAGDAQLEVVAGEVGVPDELASRIAELPGVARASGALSTTVSIDAARLPIHILGIDLLAESAGGESLRRAGIEVPDPLKLLARADAVLISAGVAARAGVGFDGALAVHAPVGPRTLHVEGLLADRGLARAYGGQVAVMDVYALQALVGRDGIVDRIEVVPAAGAALEPLRAEIERAVAGAATVRRPAERSSELDQTLVALRIVVAMIALLGSGVAALLSYAALSSAVERRLHEFAVLRSTGFAARDVARFIAADAAAYALAGTALGLVSGRVVAALLAPSMSLVSEWFRAGSIGAADVSISAGTVALGLAVGVLCALAGAIGPARLATRRYVLDETRPRPAERPRRSRLAAPGVLAAGLAASALVGGISPRVRVGAELLLGTALAASLVPAALRALARARVGLSGALPGVGHLLGTGLAARPRGAALAVAAITGLVAFVHAALVLSASFGDTLVHNIESRYPDAIDVTANAPFDAAELELLPSPVVAAIRGAPGVTDVAEHYATKLLFRGEEIDVSAIETGVAGRHRHFAGREAETFAAMGRGEIAISEAFARHFDVAPGDAIELSTLAGPRSLRVAGTLNGMAGPAGLVYMDLATFDAHWPRPGTLHVMFFTSGDPGAVIDAIRRAAPDAEPLFFTQHRELLAEARKFAVRFDALLFGVASLALLLGGIAIANLLVGIVAARQRELVLLRTAGAAPNQLAALVLCDAALLAAGACSAGVALGTLVAAPLLEIMGEALGLYVDRHFDFARLGLFLALVLAAVLASAALPAALARRTGTLQVSSFG